jgi:hypothetical protein
LGDPTSCPQKIEGSRGKKTFDWRNIVAGKSRGIKNGKREGVHHDGYKKFLKERRGEHSNSVEEAAGTDVYFISCEWH